MAVGKVASGYRPTVASKPQASPLTQQYNLYNTAVGQQAGDYDRLMQSYQQLGSGPAMQGFQSLLSNLQSGGGQAQFQNTPEAAASISNLGDLARTGGLSEEAQRNIRERGISPIRSVYANAQRNIDRQRALGGGYSPNYNATSARMTREMSDQIAGQTGKVNADLAEMIQRGRLSAAPSYASAAGSERDARNQMEMFNKRDIPQYQLAALQGMSGLQSDALRGQSSLYGTTPALSSLFGGQALNAAQLQNQITQQNKQSNLSTLGTALSGMR